MFEKECYLSAQQHKYYILVKHRGFVSLFRCFLLFIPFCGCLYLEGKMNQAFNATLDNSTSNSTDISNEKYSYEILQSFFRSFILGWVSFFLFLYTICGFFYTCYYSFRFWRIKEEDKLMERDFWDLTVTNEVS